MECEHYWFLSNIDKKEYQIKRVGIACEHRRPLIRLLFRCSRCDARGKFNIRMSSIKVDNP